MEKQSIRVNTTARLFIIDTTTIIRVEASSNYSKLFFSDGKTLVTAKLLSWFEEKLPRQSFIRLHRSHLVNNWYLQMEQCNGKEFEMQNGKVIQVSRRRRKLVWMKFLAFFMMLFFLQSNLYAQNVGIGINTPAAKLHIQGSADTSQLFIDANSTQSNSKPLLKLRSSNGSDLLWLHSDNSSNSFLGLNAGRVNNAAGGATWNTFIGSNTGNENTVGHSNTANGNNTLFNNTIGDFNTAIGRIALFDNTTGSSNTAIGGAALYNSNSSNNTAIGRNALYSNVAGGNATAVGNSAMQYSYNSATPFDNNSVAVGFEALRGGSVIANNNTGNRNTAVGYQALRNYTTGRANTANGNSALNSNTTGSYNTAIGNTALFENTAGGYNTAIGLSALLYNTTGDYNTASGESSLFNNRTGSYNSAFGKSAYFDLWDLNNTTCIGYGAGGIVDANNRIEIGNTSVVSIDGQVAWGTYSDGRIKDNITANVPGLDFITRLRPVTYNLNIHRQNEIVYSKEREAKDWPGKYDIEKIKMTGFVAQEVEKAAAEAGYNFSGVQKPANPNDMYSLRYSDFVMPLVKAVQELNQKSEEQMKMITELKKEIELLKAKQ